MSKKKKKRKKRKLNGRIVTVTALAGYTTVAVWEKGQASWLRLPAPLHSAQTHPPPSHPQNTPFKPPSSNPRRFSHYSLDSAEAVRRCLVIHSIIIFDYYNSLHFIFRKFMQLNLNHFIKQIVTTLCLAVETFVFSFSIVTLWGSALSPPTRPHSATNCQNSFKAEKLFILETKKCRCVCFCLLISCFHVNLVSFLFPLESGGLPRTTASVFSWI